MQQICTGVNGDVWCYMARSDHQVAVVDRMGLNLGDDGGEFFGRGEFQGKYLAVLRKQLATKN